MEFNAIQIAALTGGAIEGDPNTSVRNVAKIEEAGPGDLVFIANPKYEEYLYSTAASMVLLNDTVVLQREVRPTIIRVKDAYSAFALLLEKYNEMVSQQAFGRSGIEQPSFIHEKAVLGTDVYVGAFSYIAEGAQLGARVRIYPGCYIGKNVVIGEDTSIFPGVKVYDGCQLGARVAIHSGTVVGADGFGFAPLTDGSYKKVPQIGNVIIEDDVEIGSNTTIDRATMGSTIIRRGVKLDNLIQIAHNVEVGENTVIAAQTGVSGSTKVGSECLIGGQVGIVGHISLANNTRVNAKSGISKSVTTPGTTLNGSPAFDFKTSLKSGAIYRNLPDLLQRLTDLEETVRALTAELASNPTLPK